MSSLRKRRSKSGVFRGKDGLITPRDLLRWAGRKAGSKHELATNGYMLLAERLRDEEEKVLVQETIEEQFKVDIDCDELYHGKESESRRKLDMLARMKSTARTAGLTLAAIAPTKSLLRLLTLVEKCVEHKEPVLLVGGKLLSHHFAYYFLIHLLNPILRNWLWEDYCGTINEFPS
jgi:midasin